MRLCPRCRLDYMVPTPIEGKCGEVYVEYECFECGYKFLEVNDPYYIASWEPIESDDLG